MMPKVSVIIPVYRAEQYLPACLDSVLDQTLTDWEAVCVNDGSPDKCGEILVEYAQKDKRIKVINQNNQGQGKARNIGLDKATGDYIFFLDADDKLPPHALEKLYATALASKAPVVVSRNFIKENKKIKVSQTTFTIHKNSFKSFIADKKIFSTPWNKLYQADLLKKHRFIEDIFFEDWPFITEIFSTIPFYASTEIPCYFYNEHNVSTTRSEFNKHKVDSYLKGIRYTYNTFKATKLLPLAQRRMAIAAKMMINKVYKSKEQELQHYAKEEFKKLLKEKIIFLHHIPLKTILRVWRMK